MIRISYLGEQVQFTSDCPNHIDQRRELRFVKSKLSEIGILAKNKINDTKSDVDLYVPQTEFKDRKQIEDIFKKIKQEGFFKKKIPEYKFMNQPELKNNYQNSVKRNFK